MVHETRWIRPAQHAGELGLAAGRGEKVHAPDDEVHPLLEIVDGDGKLVGPVAVSVADDEIAALL